MNWKDVVTPVTDEGGNFLRADETEDFMLRKKNRRRTKRSVKW